MLKKIRKIVVQSLNLAALFLYFLYKIAVSGWLVGWAVVSGYRGENGGMIEYSPKVSSQWGLVLLFNLISMTPGSLSVDLSDDNTVIFVHLLDKGGVDDFYSVTERIERMIIRVFS